MEKIIFNSFNEFKEYSVERTKIRLNCFGYQNARITKLSHRVIKGMFKQLKNFIENGDKVDMNVYDVLLKEIEFRDTCLNMKSVFEIKIR